MDNVGGCPRIVYLVGVGLLGLLLGIPGRHSWEPLGTASEGLLCYPGLWGLPSGDCRPLGPLAASRAFGDLAALSPLHNRDVCPSPDWLSIVFHLGQSVCPLLLLASLHVPPRGQQADHASVEPAGLIWS